MAIRCELWQYIECDMGAMSVEGCGGAHAEINRKSVVAKTFAIENLCTLDVMCECLSCQGRESIYLAKASKSFINLLRAFFFSSALCPERGRLAGVCSSSLNWLWREMNISCDWHFIAERSFESPSLSHAHARVHTKSFAEFTYPLKHDLLHSECVFSFSLFDASILFYCWRRIRYSLHAIRQAIAAYHHPRRYSRYIS